MLHIQIIQVGKTKEKHFKIAEEDFLKRLSGYAKVRIDTVDDNAQIMGLVENGAHKVALDIHGVQTSSEEFAGFIQRRQFDTGKVTFIIGGPFGLPMDIIDQCNTRFSLSLMTFTHQMVRVFLLEQLYRAFTIIEGKKYHY